MNLFDDILKRPKIVRRVPHATYSASRFDYCDRLLYYKRQAVEGIEHLSFESECRMAVGNAIHTVVQDRLMHECPEAAVEVALEPLEVEGAPITGRLDVILPGDRPAEDKLVELKTLGRSTYPNAPSTGYECQGAVYWKATGIVNFEFYFFERDRVLTRIIPMTLAQLERAWGRVVATVQRVERAIKEGVPPIIEDEKSEFRCRECGYHHLCWDQEARMRGLRRPPA